MRGRNSLGAGSVYLQSTTFSIMPLDGPRPHAEDIEESRTADAVLDMTMVCGGWTVFGLIAGLLLAFICRRYFSSKANDSDSNKIETADAVHTSTDPSPGNRSSHHDLNATHSYARPESSGDRNRYVYISLYLDNVVNSANGLRLEGQRISDGPHQEQQQEQQQIQRLEEDEHQQMQHEQHFGLSIDPVHDLCTHISPHGDSSRTVTQSLINEDGACNNITDNQGCQGDKDCRKSYGNDNRRPQHIRSIRDDHPYLELITDPLDTSVNAGPACGMVPANAEVIRVDEPGSDNGQLKAGVHVEVGDCLNARFIVLDDDADRLDHRSTVVVVNMAKV